LFHPLLNRKCLAYDIHPMRKDIIERDIRHGLPEEARNVQLIFLDPPYWNMLAKDYGPDSISALDFGEWLGFLEDLAEILSNANPKFVAILIQNQTEKSIPSNMGYIDHAFLIYERMTNYGFRPERRIAVPLDSETMKPQQVIQAKEKKRMLGLVRDLLIFSKKKEENNL